MAEAEWKDIFRQVVEGYRDKTIVMPEAPQRQGGGGIRIMSNSMLFQQGRAAMMVDNATMMNMIGGGRGMAISGARSGAGATISSESSESSRMSPQTINWGVVTAPVDAAAPDQTSSYTVSQIFAVNAESSQANMAWEFIKYIHSDEAARIRSNSTVELQSRSGYETNANGVSLEAFYKLKPMRLETTRWFPKGFLGNFETIASEEIEAAVSGGKSIDDAFEAIVSKGSDALAEANLSGEKEQGGSGGIGVQSIFFAQ